MVVKLLKRYDGHRVGELAEYPDTVARELIAKGFAEPVSSVPCLAVIQSPGTERSARVVAR